MPNDIGSSKGALRLAQELAELINSNGLSSLEIRDGVEAALERNAPTMTHEELLQMGERIGLLLYKYEKELASRGKPQLGNNPGEPN